MISGATRGSGGSALARHLLSRRGGQTVRVLPARHLAGENLPDQIAELVAVSAHGSTSRPIHHLHVDPPSGSDATFIAKTFLRHYEAEFGLSHAPRCGVKHEKAGRTHFHFAYSLVTAEGRTVSLSHDYARREKVSRLTEHACGLQMVPGKHNRSVHSALIRDGRRDVANAMVAAGLLDRSRPVASTTPNERAQAERTGIPVHQIHLFALAAWRASDDAQSFSSTLGKMGLRLASGDRGAVILDTTGSAHGLSRVLAAAARKDGDRITAAMVRRRIASLTLPVMGAVSDVGSLSVAAHAASKPLTAEGKDAHKAHVTPALPQRGDFLDGTGSPSPSRRDHRSPSQVTQELVAGSAGAHAVSIHHGRRPMRAARPPQSAGKPDRKAKLVTAIVP